MIANRLFLVCTHCPSQQDALPLGHRITGGYIRPPSSVELGVFFTKHANCGNGKDHFTTAYEFSKDHELIPEDVVVVLENGATPH